MKIIRYILLVSIVLVATAGVALAWDSDHKVYKARFVPCVAALCGVDSAATLDVGEVEVTSDGRVSVELEGSNIINGTLAVSYQPINGAAVSIGVFNTDAYGSLDSGDDDYDGWGCEREDGEDTMVGILNTTTSMGIFIISDAVPDTNGVINNYFVTAFSTTPELTGPQPGAFDDISSMGELKSAYKQKTALASKGVKSQTNSLSKSLAKTRTRLKQDYQSRAAALSN